MQGLLIIKRRAVHIIIYVVDMNKEGAAYDIMLKLEIY